MLTPGPPQTSCPRLLGGFSRAILLVHLFVHRKCQEWFLCHLAGTGLWAGIWPPLSEEFHCYMLVRLELSHHLSFFVLFIYLFYKCCLWQHAHIYICISRSLEIVQPGGFLNDTVTLILLLFHYTWKGRQLKEAMSVRLLLLALNPLPNFLNPQQMWRTSLSNVTKSKKVQHWGWPGGSGG